MIKLLWKTVTEVLMICRDNGTYIELRDLAALGKAAAECISAVGTVKASRIAEGLLSDLRRIKRASSEIEERYGGGSDVPKAAEWLLDNRYIAEREGLDASYALKGGQRLPKDEKHGCSALETAVSVLVSAGRGEITHERISAFLDGYQKSRILSEGELRVFIPVLKAAITALLKSNCEGDIESDAAAEVMENVFSSLRFLEGYDALGLLESVNRIDAVLRTDPAGVYSKMDEETRIAYRAEVSKLAKKHGIGEYDAAKRATELAEKNDCHVGQFLFREPLGEKKRKKNGGTYIASTVLLTLFLTLLPGIVLENAAVTFLLLFPVWEMVKNLIDFAVTRLVLPVRLPRLDLEGGIPPEGKTICVISVLVTGKESARDAVRMLEEYSITNRDAGNNLKFGLLADLKEADNKSAPGDRELTDFASEEIGKLNRKYGERFYLLMRGRTKCPSSGKYMGWERKRGAILELVRFLKGKPSGITVRAGDVSALEGTAYILTLDSDTRLTAGAAVQLVGAAMHPLNRPVINGKGTVTEGYGILQPRVSTELKSAVRSDFTRIFAGQGGIDPYGGSVSDVYQDLCGSGSFVGKGLINADVYYKCLDSRFPADRILSHDILEGAFVGCGYMSDTELADSCPPKVVSYYRRMHRWVRGDWQNIVYLGRRIRDAEGAVTPNPLSDLNKWKIFDNLRRSLTPVFTLAALVIAMLSEWQVFGWAALAAVLSAFSNLLITSAALLFRQRSGVRFLSGLISGFGGILMQTVIRLMFLPYEAWICISAILLSLYRMAVTKRNLLQWTTAADSDRETGSGAAYYYRKMAACPAAGIAVLLLTPYPPACAVGIVWLLTPFYAWALSKGIEHTKQVSRRDRRYLVSAAGDIWRYFEDFVTPADSFLPPDNWQEHPASGAAHRTSPTNIGLALLSSLAAVDLELAPKEKALGIIENIMTAVRRLPKWNGHLYNWYDTKTCKVLEPAYVSTVDSGNLAGCLIALREGLTEFKEHRLAAMAEDLYKAMSFTPLFDLKRGLFYIGWDAVKNRPAKSYYDLLASEARQTGYVAIAKGDVPRKHWRKLSRAMVSYNGYCGMASWTGTMFEYLMPDLLLPCYRDSLLYESAKFCVYVQKHNKRTPVWGESESAFFSFDPALNYRYKAHGVQKLALKRGLDADNVVSPYSSFLALNVDFRSAVSNLKALEQLGAVGKYGFYEAVDFTPPRTCGEELKLVRTFMVHHLGMSIVSIDNALNEGVMQKRFMRDTNMASFSELLQEKIPTGAVVLSRKPGKTPQKPERAHGGEWVREYGSREPRAPACCLLSNGAYTVMLSDSGGSRSLWRGLDVTRFVPEQDSEHRGIRIDIISSEGETCLNPGFAVQPGVEFGAEFSGSQGKLSARTGKAAAAVAVRVPGDENGELRVISLNRTDSTPLDGILRISFTPVLAKAADFEAHPLFSKLSLEAAVKDERLVIKRRSRGNDKAVYLCTACDSPVTWSVEGGEERGNPTVMKRWSTEMKATASIPFSLSPDSEETVRFAMGVGDTEASAVSAAESILISRETGGSRLDRSAAELGLSPAGVKAAMEHLTELVYAADKRRERSADIIQNTEGREGLWRFGISGDLPILTAEVTGEDELPGAAELLKQHSLLKDNGMDFDLVLILNDNGDYMMPRRRAAAEWLRRSGREYLIGAKGGVHLIDGSSPNVGVIRAMSDKIADLKGKY
ncbi:MAG: hypothetical protein IJL71_00920 [Oscillospiraceae bacterium]|nr:hypothetical protein [Oscillospiraceae bacterium]